MYESVRFYRQIATPTYVATPTTVAYVGPGDIVANALVWWGLRAYSLASIGGNAIRLRRASDDAEQNFVTVAGGGLDLTSITSFAGGSKLFVVTLYDQTGNGFHLTESGPTFQPEFVPGGLGSLPVMNITLAIPGDSSPDRLRVTGPTQAQPFTGSLVINRAVVSSAFDNAMSGGSGSVGLFFGAGGADKVTIYAGNTAFGDVTANDNAWHTLQGALNGASSSLTVDGSTSTGAGTVGTSSLSGSLAFGLDAGGDNFTGAIVEGGYWAGVFSAGNITAMDANQQAYWGFASLDADFLNWLYQVYRYGGTVSTARRVVVNNLITSLKADGIWTKLDRLWLFAAENEASALTDIVATALATKFGSPPFATDFGYTGEDTATPTNCLESNYIPSTNGVTYVQNSAHLSTWVVANVASAAGGAVLGANNAGASANIYDTYTDSNVYGRINDSGFSAGQGTPGTRAGQWLINRDSSSTTQLYQNGSLFSSPNQGSASPPSVEIFITCENQNGSRILGTPNQVAMVSIGGSLNGTDATNFYNDIRTYMTAVGVP